MYSSRRCPYEFLFADDIVVRSGSTPQINPTLVDDNGYSMDSIFGPIMVSREW